MADASAEKLSELRHRIEAYAADIEAHLKVPAGTIRGASMDTDFVFVLKMWGVIEPLVKEAVQANVRKAIEHPKVAASGSEALMKAINDLAIDRLRKILFEFGAIEEGDSDFIEALSAIRNRYAHHVRNAALSIREICDKIAAEPKGNKQLLIKLTGFKKDVDLPCDVVRLVTFYNTILILRKVLNFAKPPPALKEFLGIA
jgi:hypothetical protein